MRFRILGPVAVSSGAGWRGISAAKERTLLAALIVRSTQVVSMDQLVLDDAAYSAQVRPLLPSAGLCAVLVTGRRLLTDIAGARHLELGVLPEPDARRLFTGIIGTERVAAEPDEATAILRACAGLPLAIRIAAGRLVGRPAWPLRLLRERLDDDSKRLNELKLGDLGVRAGFEASMRTLTVGAVRAFRLLGLLGPRTFPEWVLGPLLDEPEAGDTLDELVDANLVQQSGMDSSGRPRYRLHDLLRAYAIESAGAIPETERRDAVRRLADARAARAGAGAGARI